MLEKQPVDPPLGEICRLADDIFRERVLWARQIPPDQKIAMGLQLFDWEVRRTLEGIRQQHPDADEVRVRAIFSNRMRIKRCFDEAGIYRDVQEET